MVVTGDIEVIGDLSELEFLVKEFERKIYNCQFDDRLIDIIGLIGGHHRRYTKAVYLKEGTDERNRFDKAIDSFMKSKRAFKDVCICSRK